MISHFLTKKHFLMRKILYIDIWEYYGDILMIVKSLSTIIKCSKTSLQTPSQINQFVTRTLASGVDDVVRVVSVVLTTHCG